MRRDEAADEVRAAGGEHVLVSGPDLAADIARQLDGEQVSLVLDGLGGDTATALVGALRFGGNIVTYGSLGADRRRYRMPTCWGANCGTRVFGCSPG